MKVLFVSPIVPWPLDCGGRIRTFKLLHALARRVEVHFRAVRQPEVDARAAEHLARCCASVRVFERGPAGAVRRWTRTRPERWFFSADLRAALASELAHDDFDLVHLDELCVARALPPSSAVPVVVHHHKLDTVLHEMLPAESLAQKGFEGWKLARLEAGAARQYRDHVTCSDFDARTLRSRYPGIACSVVANGFDAEYFRPRACARDPERILFLGSMSYGPNVDGVVWFAREILPRIRAARPEVVLDVVGRDPAPRVRALAGERIRVVGAVRDVRPHLARAALMVAPLRIGGGTRLKLVDALAMHCPVVATRTAAEGLALRDGEHLALADEPAAFARAVVDALADPAAAQARARRGAGLAHERYTWDLLAGELLDAWRLAAAGARQPAAASA